MVVTIIEIIFTSSCQIIPHAVIIQLMKSFVLPVVFAFFLFTLILPSYSFAISQSTLTKESILPGSLLYPFKRLSEKIGSVLRFTPDSKYRYQKGLFERRTSELNSIVENNSTEQVETTAQRFAYQAGVLEQASENKNDFKSGTRELFSIYIPTLEKLRDHFPANSSYWLVVQQDIDTLNILSSKLK